MPTSIERADVQRLIAEGAQLVEVLPSSAYTQAHIPRALNIPLQHLDQESTAGLRQDRPLVVYCYDRQ